MQGTVIESKCKTPPIGSGRRQHMASGYHYVTHSYDSAMLLLLWPHWLTYTHKDDSSSVLMVIEGGGIFFGALQNPWPNILVLDVLEVLDALAAPILEELAALHWETVNQVRTATKISRSALGQVDPPAVFGGTAANLPHLLSSKDLSKPALLDDERHFCLSSQTAAFPCFLLVFDRARAASLTHALVAA